VNDPMHAQAREEVDIKVIQQVKEKREGSGKVKASKGGKQRVEAKLDAKYRSSSRNKTKQGILGALED
jgi:hypothetical protein